MLRRLMLIPFVLVAVLPFVFSACGDSNGGGDEATPTSDTSGPTRTPQTSGIGTLEFSPAEPAVGAEIVVSGDGWGQDAMTFYLILGEAGNTAAQLIAAGQAAELGEATPDASGRVEFRFALEGSLPTQEGDPIEVVAGEQYSVAALQGNRGTSTLPFTAQ